MVNIVMDNSIFHSSNLVSNRYLADPELESPLFLRLVNRNKLSP
jgi:hypothetical protein